MDNEARFFENGEFLRGMDWNRTSQFGEDGLIQTALLRIGIKHRWCFEVGAADGVYLSNTHRLWSELYWNAVLIEADDANFAKLQDFSSERIRCVHSRVIPGELDRILSEADAPSDLDLGVIDIDGQDYYLWKSLWMFQPRLMLIEYSPYDGPDAMPESSPQKQAGINPILSLGASKGYLPLVQTYCNVLFVREDVWNA